MDEQTNESVRCGVVPCRAVRSWSERRQHPIVLVWIGSNFLSSDSPSSIAFIVCFSHSNEIRSTYLWHPFRRMPTASFLPSQTNSAVVSSAIPSDSIRLLQTFKLGNGIVACLPVPGKRAIDIDTDLLSRKPRASRRLLG